MWTILFFLLHSLKCSGENDRRFIESRPGRSATIRGGVNEPSRILKFHWFHNHLNVKALVGAFNKEDTLVGALYVIRNFKLREG